jgi:[ribosomal protein S5]-alanine N-acetyltransferase
VLPQFETQSLSLRPYEQGDALALFHIMSDATAMQHTYVAASLEQCAARLNAYEGQRQKNGFAPWVVRNLKTRHVVGWGGLNIDPEAPQWGLEVGYAFAPTSWGKGYATELVQFSLECAFGTLAAPEVHAYARPENAASIRVLSKCGLIMLRYEPALQRNHYLVNAPSAA